MDTKSIIDLNEYKTPGSKVFTGRDRGIKIRVNSKIDDLIKEGNNIDIIIPNDIMSVNPSFLEELLYNVVKLLGKENFSSRIKFIDTNPRYSIKVDLEEAIERILRKNNALKL